jgi:hypothetical protein
MLSTRNRSQTSTHKSPKSNDFPRPRGPRLARTAPIRDAWPDWILDSAAHLTAQHGLELPAEKRRERSASLGATRPIVPERVRCFDGQSFAFLPHRFLREGYFAALDADELGL